MTHIIFISIKDKYVQWKEPKQANKVKKSRDKFCKKKKILTHYTQQKMNDSIGRERRLSIFSSGR